MDERPEFNQDFLDLIRELQTAAVDFVVVGAHALAAHGVVRATGDLDILVRPTRDNADRVVAALQAFGAPLASHGASAEDFAREGTVYQLGLPPSRIDVMTSISGVGFDQVKEDAMTVHAGGVAMPVMGREALLANKRAAGRPKDLDDLERLERRGSGDS